MPWQFFTRLEFASGFACLLKCRASIVFATCIFPDNPERTDERESLRTRGYTSYACTLHAPYVFMLPTEEGSRLRSPKFVWRPYYFVKLDPNKKRSPNLYNVLQSPTTIAETHFMSESSVVECTPHTVFHGLILTFPKEKVVVQVPHVVWISDRHWTRIRKDPPRRSRH
jgi:hypothetical protein